MRRILCFLLACLMLVTTVPFAMAANSTSSTQTKATFYVETLEGKKGDILLVDVYLLDKQTEIGALTVTLTYNHQLLQPVKHPESNGSANDNMVGGEVLRNVGATWAAGNDKFTAASSNGLWISGVLFSAAFQVTGDLLAGDFTPISLLVNHIDHYEYYNDPNYSYDVDVISGGIVGHAASSPDLSIPNEFRVDGNLDVWYLTQDDQEAITDDNYYHYVELQPYEKSNGVTFYPDANTATQVWTAYDANYIYFYVKVWDNKIVTWDPNGLHSFTTDSSYVDSIELWVDPDPKSQTHTFTYNSSGKISRETAKSSYTTNFYQQTQDAAQGDVQVRLLLGNMQRHDFHNLVKPGYNGTTFKTWIEDSNNFCPFSFTDEEVVTLSGEKVSSGFGVEARFPRNNDSSNSYRFNVAVNNSASNEWERYALATNPGWWIDINNTWNVNFNNSRNPFLNQAASQVASKKTVYGHSAINDIGGGNALVKRITTLMSKAVSTDLKAEIDQIAADYDALPELQRGYVRFRNYNEFLARKKAVDRLIAKTTTTPVIEAIASLDVQGLEDKAAVVAARTAYNALTAKQRIQVSNYSDLQAAEAKIAEFETQVTEVVNAIAALPEVNRVSVNHKPQVVLARASYNALTDAQKAQVTNYSKLQSLEARIAELESYVDQDTLDQALADTVINTINAFPNPLTINDKATVEEARILYNDLTDAQKALVTNYSKLVAAEAEMARLETLAADQAAANAVMTKIDALNVTRLENKTDVVAARNAYEALTPTQKGYVTNLAKLEAAEATILQLERQAEVDNVISMIAALKVTSINNKSQVVAARNAYNALDAQQKAGVTNLSKLETAEATIRQFEAEIAAAARVENLIYGLPENVTEADAEQVKAVRDEYNALSDYAKSYVSQDAYNLLKDKLKAADVALGVVDVQYRALDNYGSDRAIDGSTPYSHGPDTSDYLEGSASFSIRWRYRTSGDIFIYLYHYNQGRDPNGGYNEDTEDGKWMVDTFENEGSWLVEVPDATAGYMNVAFDLYVSNANTLKNATGDCGFSFDIFAPHQWGDGGYSSKESLMAAFAAANNGAGLKTGWNHIVLPLTFTQDVAGQTVNIYDLRLYFVGVTIPSNFYLKIDDIRFMNQEAVDTILVERNKAKDVSIAIKNLATYYTYAQGKAIVDLYSTVSEDYKDMVIGYDTFYSKYKSRFANQVAGDEVTAQIAALNVQSLADEAAVLAARNTYDNLTNTQKGYVTNYAKLQEAEAAIAELKDSPAVKNVIALIDALNVQSLADEAAVSAARAAYGDLTAEQQALVTNYAELQAAETKIFQLKQAAIAKEVDDQIAALNVQSLDDAADVTAARLAYNKLTDTQKGYVTNLSALEAAEAKIAELQAAADKEAADKAAAQAVADQIASLNVQSLADEAAVTAARLAYNKLTDTQKGYVTNLSALEAAEAKIAELQAAADKEAADKAAAQTVIDQIAALNVQSLADEAAVVAARAAYTALTDDQKALVNNVAALEAAEAKIAELKTDVDVKNGPVDGYFYDNGTLVKAYKVVSFEGNYYFVADGNRIVTNNAMAMSASLLAGTDLPAGYYSFDANGVMTPATGVYGGKYYKNGVTDCLYQVVEFEGNYYFVSDGYRVATNTTTYLDAKFTENVGLTKGLYAFDENGVMSPATDIYMGKYYENGQNAKLYRVVEFKGNYYYVSDRYKVLTNTTMVLSAAFMTEVDLPAGCYHFAADGKMSPATGVYDGKYYKDGVNACLYQVVEFEGNYYFVDNGYRVAKNTTVYLGEAFTANVGLPKGLYAFDANGVMTPATDIYLGKYYENSQPAKLYQVIEFKGNYYYVGDRYKVATNTAMYLSAGFTANVGLPAGAYQFDENGIMTPATGVVDGKYYENGKPAKLYQLVESDGNYYFVSDGYRVVKNTTVTLKESMTAPFGLPAGTYEFDAEGKMILN